MAEVRTLSGRKIDWNNHPKANAKCSLVLDGKKVVGGFRSLCALNRMNNYVRKTYGRDIHVFQGAFNLSVAASAGTHDLDACFDWYIPGVSFYTTQKIGRRFGFGCWYRHAPKFSNHVHGFVLPPGRKFSSRGIKVGIYVDGGLSIHGHKTTSSQLDDYYNHAFGLSGEHEHNSDHSWFPPDIDATIFNLGLYVKRRQTKAAA